MVKTLPPQKQNPPGKESDMTPRPRSGVTTYQGSGKLMGKIALITGGDSGIGRAVALAFAREGSNSAIVYNEQDSDAYETKKMIEDEGAKALLIKGDVGDEKFCVQAVENTVKELGKLDVLINNAAEQHPKGSLEDITSEQLERTFKTNIFGYFYMAKAALKYLQEGSCIVNTTSVTAYRGSEDLLDYSSTKGAIVSFTRSLAKNLASKKIRVNAVAPGPIWTPLIPSTFPEQKVEEFGANVPVGRPGQPEEIAPSFVFLASQDSSYMTGQVLHPNGGEIING